MQSAQEARQSVLDQLELNDANRTMNSTNFVDQAVMCLQSMLPKIESIRVDFLHHFCTFVVFSNQQF
jgi:hypothetical protein